MTRLPLDKIGYHTQEIPPGEYGSFTKIQEETAEFLDAVEQGCRVMALIELSDLYGAMRGYLKTNHPEFSMADLERMSDITERAFRNGHRN